MSKWRRSMFLSIVTLPVFAVPLLAGNVGWRLVDFSKWGERQGKRFQEWRWAETDAQGSPEDQP